MICAHFDRIFYQALRFLESDELEKEVNDMCTAARSKGITGVPITIIDSKWAVTGGQSADVYIQVSRCLSVTFDCSIRRRSSRNSPRPVLALPHPPCLPQQWRPTFAHDIIERPQLLFVSFETAVVGDLS